MTDPREALADIMQCLDHGIGEANIPKCVAETGEWCGNGCTCDYTDDMFCVCGDCVPCDDPDCDMHKARSAVDTLRTHLDGEAGRLRAAETAAMEEACAACHTCTKGTPDGVAARLLKARREALKEACEELCEHCNCGDTPVMKWGMWKHGEDRCDAGAIRHLFDTEPTP